MSDEQEFEMIEREEEYVLFLGRPSRFRHQLSRPKVEGPIEFIDEWSPGFSIITHTSYLQQEEGAWVAYTTPEMTESFPKEYQEGVVHEPRFQRALEQLGTPTLEELAALNLSKYRR